MPSFAPFLHQFGCYTTTTQLVQCTSNENAGHIYAYSRWKRPRLNISEMWTLRICRKRNAKHSVWLTVLRIVIIDNADSLDVHRFTKVDWQPWLSGSFGTWHCSQVAVNGPGSSEDLIRTALNCGSPQCHVLYNIERSFPPKRYKKLIRRWDSERELSLRRHCTRTKNTIYSCINSATHRFLQRKFIKFSEITQCNGHYAVQGHSRSPILVPIES